MRYVLEYTVENLHSDLAKINRMYNEGKLNAFEALAKVEKAIGHYQDNN